MEWPLSMALAEMKQRLHALRERQAGWADGRADGRGLGGVRWLGFWWAEGKHVKSGGKKAKETEANDGVLNPS